MSLFEIQQEETFHVNYLNSHAPPTMDHEDETHTPSDDAATNPQHQRTDDNGNQHANNGSDATSGNGRGRGVIRRRNGRRRRTTTIVRTSTISPKYSRPGRPKHAYLLELFYGVVIYVTCILLPSFPFYIYVTYTYVSSRMNIVRERVLWSIWICWRFSLMVMERLGWMDDPFRTIDRKDAGLSEGELSNMTLFRRKVRKFIFSTSTASLWEEFNQQQKQADATDAPSPYTWGFGRTSSAFPSILMVLQDVQFLITLAVLLAIIRIWFVHMLVPEFLAPRRLEAMTRCKSSHLLSSSSYKFEDLKGWDKARDRVGARRESLSGRYTVDPSSLEREGGEKRGWYDRILMRASYHWYRLRPSIRRALGHEPSARYNDLFATQQAPSSSPFRRSGTTPNPTQHLFSAPRYATATFRLLYTSISCISALLFFRSAEFWPRQVLGTNPHASTRHCWDLSGSFSALGDLDDDYDARNGALKYFFLSQAAYQLQSVCFHIVSMLLLLFYGGGAAGAGGNKAGGWVSRLLRRFRGQDPSQQQQQNNPFHQKEKQKQRLISMKTSMQSYARPMVEHVIVLAVLTGAYLFSGLRRLGAVGITTLELSSIFLQLLQVCIYAPENSWLRKPEVVLFVHRVLTIPTFIYCRLVVLPFVLWRSSLFESQEWLEQIEKVFSPGWAERLYYMFNGALCLIFALNLVLFRRLLFHPHLKQIVKQKRDGNH